MTQTWECFVARLLLAHLSFVLSFQIVDIYL
jgi:hypothetical protein